PPDVRDARGRDGRGRRPDRRPTDGVRLPRGSRMRSRITGLGAHLPERVVHNDELGPLLGRTSEWIAQRSGIVERRWAAADEGTSALAVVAAREALADAGMEPGDVDLIVFATYTPDHYIPGS